MIAVTKKVVGVFVRFRAPLQQRHQTNTNGSSAAGHSVTYKRWPARQQKSVGRLANANLLL
jgi:hypothetical protein